MDLQSLATHRRRTEAVSTLLHDRLEGHLETLRPLLGPERILGKHVDGRNEVPGAERALSQLLQAYKELPPAPYSLPREFDPQWLRSVGSEIRLYSWEYSHAAKADSGPKTITLSSPLRWQFTYASDYTLSQFLSALAGRTPRRPDHLRQFVVNALVAQLVFASSPGLRSLFADLRFEVRIGDETNLPKLPLVTLHGCLPSVRPPDDLILAATAFSGVPAFIELVGLDALANLPDPLRAALAAAAA